MALLILLSLACGGLTRGKAEPVKEQTIAPASTKNALSQTPGQADLTRFLGDQRGCDRSASLPGPAELW